MKRSSPNIQEKFYRNLYENYQEMSEFLTSTLDSQYHDTEEMRYLHDFVHYKGLDEEYTYFRANAHEDTSKDVPFPTLTL